MIEATLQEQREAEFQKEIAKWGPIDDSDIPF